MKTRTEGRKRIKAPQEIINWNKNPWQSQETMNRGEREKTRTNNTSNKSLKIQNVDTENNKEFKSVFFSLQSLVATKPGILAWISSNLNYAQSRHNIKLKCRNVAKLTTVRDWN